MIRINYKPLFDWWSNNDGKKYDDKFNLFAVATANYSTPLYYLSKIFKSPLNQLDIPQTRFIIGQLLPYTTYVLGGKQYGILTPKSLCETVKLSRLDNDDLFNDWFDNFGSRGGKLIKEGAELTYTQDAGVIDPKTGRTKYTYSLVPNTGDDANYYGLYPGTLARESWCGLILEWLGGEKGDWVMETDDDNLLHPVPKDGLQNSLGVWFQNNGVGRGDNFIARMGMLPTAPMVVYFCNNQYSTQGMKVDPQSFANLLEPAGSMAGGWIGFLNGSNGSTYDDYTNVLRTRTDDPSPPTPPQCQGPNIGKGFMAGITSFLGIAIMAALGPEGWAMGFVLGAAAITGGISGAQAGAGTC